VVGSIVPEAATACETVPVPTVTSRVAGPAAAVLEGRVFTHVMEAPAATSSATTVMMAIRRRLSLPARPARDVEARFTFTRRA
jgi:hypothetical protein